MHHNYWARVLELRNYNFWAHVLQLLKPWNPGACVPQQENPPRWEVHALVAVVQSPSCVQLFATSWTAAHQAFLSHISSWSLPKFISIALVMPSTILSSAALFFYLQSFPVSESFLMSQLFASLAKVLAFQLQHQSF